jgi:hypothetical protein
VTVLPTLKDLSARKLKVVRVPANLNYKRDARRPALDLEKDHFKRLSVKVDWYPRIEALKATGQNTITLQGKRHDGKPGATHLAFLDREALHDLWRDWHRQEFQELTNKSESLPPRRGASFERKDEKPIEHYHS